MTLRSWPLLAGAALLVLLALLVPLQYRWLSQVSDAEREQLRTSMRTRAADFARDFDREVTRAYTAFWLDAGAFERDPAGALSDAYARARSQSVAGGIIKDVYVVNGRAAAAGSLERLDPETRTLAPADWPASFQALRNRLDRERLVVRGFGGLPRVPPPPGAIDGAALALVVPVLQLPPANESRPWAPDALPTAPAIVLALDGERVTQTLVESLVTMHFGRLDAADYLVTVVPRDEPSRIIYASAGDAVVTPATADVALGLFNLRLDEASAPAAAADGSPAGRGQNFAVMVRREAGTPALSADAQGAWQVLVRGRRGSLEAVVAQSRRRNLAISLGVLGLLGASFVLVIASAQRQQHLARQQMEFVASVSHELRTPLAVIRSAGDNLADGLVTDGAQVREHGALVRAEGRRLTDMVERVMTFAGMSSGAPLRMRPDVDVAHVVREVVSEMTAEAADRRIALDVRLSGALPPVAADPAALRSALQNIVGNAIKFSRTGGTVEVEARAMGARISIAVTDAGIGIDEADLPYIFRPFYRGRRAVDAQVRGTGVGLSIVRRVVDAHQGDIQVQSRVDEGTTVTVTLPVALATARVPAAEAEARS